MQPTPRRAKICELHATRSVVRNCLKIAQLGAVWAASLIQDDRFSPQKAQAPLANGAGQITRIGASTTLRPAESAALINAIQKHLREETRLGIPTLLHEESCAYFLARDATQFPQAIGMASTWAWIGSRRWAP